PTPFWTAVHEESLNARSVQLVPRLLPVGTVNRAFAPVLTRVTGMMLIGIPYEMSSTCIGGLYCDATLKSGRKSDTGSAGSAFSLKFVCSGRPAIRRFLFDAKITIYWLGGRFVLGKSHRVLLSANFQ